MARRMLAHSTAQLLCGHKRPHPTVVKVVSKRSDYFQSCIEHHALHLLKAHSASAFLFRNSCFQNSRLFSGS